MNIPKNALEVYKELSIHEKITAHSWRYVMTSNQQNPCFEDSVIIAIEWHYRKKHQKFELCLYDYRKHPKKKILFAKQSTL